MLAISGVAVLGLIGTAIGVATALGIAIAILFANFKKTNKDILRQDLQDVKARLVTVETAEKNCNERLARAESTIQTLTDVVTGASAVAELKEIVDNNHQSIMAKLDSLSRA